MVPQKTQKSYHFDMKKFSLVFVCALLVFSVVGFDVYSIHQSKKYIVSCKGVSDQPFPLSAKQNFYFLTKSSSSIVFASDDGSSVFKLFINKPFSKSSWREYIPLLSDLSKMRKFYRARKAKFEACCNAEKLMPRDTGILYYHLTPTDHLREKITLHGDHGAIFNINLDEAEYYIQKKATVSSDYFKTAPLEQAKESLRKLLVFTKQRYNEGIVMIDLQLESNFGFINDEPVRLDIEHLKQDPKWAQNHHKHFAEQTALFRSWLKDNRPELISHYDDTLEQL